MVSRFLQACLSLLIMAVVVVFAVLNRGDIQVMLTPLHAPVDAPLYAVILLSLLFGFIAGAAMHALFGMERGRQLRAQARTIRRLEKENEEARRAQMLRGTDGALISPQPLSYPSSGKVRRAG